MFSDSTITENETRRDLPAHLEQLLRTICFRIRVQGREALKNYSITAAQFDLLQRVYFNGPQTMTKLSQSLGIAKSTTSGLVTRLVRDGFLDRRRDETDRRVFTVAITPLGEQVIKSVIEMRVRYVEEVIKQIPEEKITLVHNALDILYEVMSPKQH
ncbi:transcriptional regulator, MarR family [Fervidobacterium changbaicum]|uniref:MarR family transcriptional regulator n=2 Tax=Fervidobacterium TaxID=2422 RepID=A0AAI8CKY0_FERIS|nr:MULTISPECIES: MarR family transcriptional regulator [Fervidobacterium]AMW32494.1 MarR family transcriptional regulator [Fervidobacterium islandicum]QAV32664.1 MarR family transcriptional regulator [Fervidobacterium changbaicum]SDH43252.1 transcriptional regulator, MarR family [Fervidobacterium changbaicum]